MYAFRCISLQCKRNPGQVLNRWPACLLQAAIGIPPIRINTSIQKSHSNAYAMIGRHAWRLQSLQSLLLTAQHTQRYDFSLQDVEPIWAPVLDSSSKWLVCKFPRGNSEGNWTQCFEDLLRCDLHTQKCKKCCKMLQRDQKGMYIRGLRAHRGTGGAVAHCVGSTHLYTGLAAPEKFPAWKLVASSMAILTSLIATRVPCNQGSCVTRSAPKLMRWPNDNDHDDPDDGDGDGANNDEMNMMRMMRQRDAFFGGFRMFLKTIQLFQYDRFFWCLNLGSWGPSSLCPSLLPMVPSMPRLHDVSTSSTTLAQLSSTCHTPSQPWPMAWQTTCCVLRWKTSPQIFYNPHKSKQNLTTCSVWQKCTRPRHTSLYSPTRLTPPNTLRIQRLIQSNIPMFSSASTCQLHGFMLTVQHVFNNCGCENPYCDTVIYSAVLMEVGTEKESLSSLPIFGDSFRMIKTKRDGTANVWRQRYIIKETVIKKEETYLIS